MDEYVDRGDAGGFGEFPPLVGTAYEFDRGMKTSFIFTGRVINWPDIPVYQLFFSILSLVVSFLHSSFSYSV
jgi:hypothetical protein